MVSDNQSARHTMIQLLTKRLDMLSWSPIPGTAKAMGKTSSKYSYLTMRIRSGPKTFVVSKVRKVMYAREIVNNLPTVTEASWFFEFLLNPGLAEDMRR